MISIEVTTPLDPIRIEQFVNSDILITTGGTYRDNIAGSNLTAALRLEAMPSAFPRISPPVAAQSFPFQR